MIAIGTPFIELLDKDELNLTQYCVLYCYAYNKVNLLETYFKKNRDDIIHVRSLIDRGYLEAPNGGKLQNITPTMKCISYIKDLVDSYADVKAENILSDDDEMFDLIDDIYKDEFNLFHETYPVTTIRTNGFKSSLRENKKQCKELFIQTLKDKKISASNLQKCLLFYLEEKKKGGDMAYIKTMRNFLKEETWRDVLEKMNMDDNNNDIDYGGKLI
tara:strand:- start:2586 stop:3233 length:648 start_codon:yes stop_codon:yes gene_type:complete